MEDMLAFYRNKKILVTGQTGFKGAWLCMILKQAGANVVGYALEPPTKPNLFELLQIDKKILSIEGDIRDLNCLTKCFEENQPEIVIHMAAQPIVSMSYEQPVHTYETNVMGTVNILECIRNTDSVQQTKYTIITSGIGDIGRTTDWEDLILILIVKHARKW